MMMSHKTRPQRLLVDSRLRQCGSLDGMITSVTAAESSLVVRDFGSELARTSATIDGASITPLNLTIGVTTAPALNVIDGGAVKDVMRQLAALANLMSGSLEAINFRLKAMEDSQDEVWSSSARAPNSAV